MGVREATRGTGVVGRRSARVLWSLTGIVLALLLLKFFVGDVYPVKSGSMRPTLFGGADPDGNVLNEDVLVLYGAPRIERFELVVVRSRDGGDPIVKRVSGLPGESIEIDGGDLLIDGARLPASARRPDPVPIFDGRTLSVEAFFHYEPSLWTREDRGGRSPWRVDASEVARDADRGMMFFQKDLTDAYLDPGGERVSGLRQVNDGILECECRLEPAAAPGARLRFHLLEEGDTFQALLEPDPAGGVRARLTRRNAKTLERSDPEQRTEILAEGGVAFEPGVWHRVRFSNVDNHLALEVDGTVALAHDYAANVRHPARMAPGYKSIGPRVGFGAEGCVAAFRDVRVLRDLFYTDAGRFAVGAPLFVGPAEYFVLGDNSAESSDSRQFGTIRASEILGRPFAVVWPLARVRRL